MNSKVYPRVQNNDSPCYAVTPFWTGGESAFIKDTHTDQKNDVDLSQFSFYPPKKVYPLNFPQIPN